MTEEKSIEVINENTMLERGFFTANGYTFMVRPIYLGEESLYLSEMTVSPVPNIENDKPIEEMTDKQLGSYAIALFSGTINEEENVKIKPNFFKKLFGRKNYRYYDNMPAVQPLIKWIEKKVSYKGRNIKFYDLERKYGLNKAEIEKLFIYFHEISGF